MSQAKVALQNSSKSVLLDFTFLLHTALLTTALFLLPAHWDLPEGTLGTGWETRASGSLLWKVVLSWDLEKQFGHLTKWTEVTPFLET